MKNKLLFLSIYAFLVSQNIYSFIGKITVIGNPETGKIIIKCADFHNVGSTEDNLDELNAYTKALKDVSKNGETVKVLLESPSAYGLNMDKQEDVDKLFEFLTLRLDMSKNEIIESLKDYQLFSSLILRFVDNKKKFKNIELKSIDPRGALEKIVTSLENLQSKKIKQKDLVSKFNSIQDILNDLRNQINELDYDKNKVLANILNSMIVELNNEYQKLGTKFKIFENKNKKQKSRFLSNKKIKSFLDAINDEEFFLTTLDISYLLNIMQNNATDKIVAVIGNWHSENLEKYEEMLGYNQLLQIQMNQTVIDTMEIGQSIEPENKQFLINYAQELIQMSNQEIWNFELHS